MKSLDIAIIGLGNQAKAWALNLRDSNQKVCIYLRDNSASFEIAKELGLIAKPLSEVSKKSHDCYVLLAPDHSHRDILTTNPFPDSAKFVLAHGHSYVYQELKSINKSWTFLLLAPKAIASELRYAYETKGKLGAMMCAKSEEDIALINSLAKAIGITSGPHASSFEEETYADLFSEQALLCSMLPYGALACYNKLRQKGISKEAAYFECWHEMKLIIDALLKVGPDKFFDLISPNAFIGSQKTKGFFESPQFTNFLDEIWDDIQSGKFEEIGKRTNLQQQRELAKNFWQEQELSKTYQQVKEDLYH